MPPDVKVSGLPQDSSVDGSHYVVLNDPSGPTTKRGLLSVLAAFFFNQVNIPAGSGSPVTRAAENVFDYVASGMVWAGDAYASTRNASMSAGVVYINGRRIAISAVVARSFTASRDTYVDVLDNQDGTGTLVYTEVTNNNASPALASNSLRIGIVITGASNIASVASINQGQLDKVLPIASSIPYTYTDSIGNIICPRNGSLYRMIGYRQATATTATTGTSDVPPCNMNVIVPTGRSIECRAFGGGMTSSVANSAVLLAIQDVTGGVQLCSGGSATNASGDAAFATPFRHFTPNTFGVRNLKLQVARGTNAATVNTNGSATNPVQLAVYLT